MLQLDLIMNKSYIVKYKIIDDMRTIRFNNNRRISSSLFLRKEGRRETSVSNASGDKILKGKVPFLLLFFLLFLGSCSSDFLDNKPTDAVDSGLVPVECRTHL